jgi:hypothetical protein
LIKRYFMMPPERWQHYNDALSSHELKPNFRRLSTTTLSRWALKMLMIIVSFRPLLQNMDSTSHELAMGFAIKSILKDLLPRVGSF